MGKITHLSESWTRFYDGSKTVESSQPLRKISIRDVFPNLSDDQLKEAEESFCRYLEVGLRIHQNAVHSSADLDRSQPSLNMKERSNSNSIEHG